MLPPRIQDEGTSGKENPSKGALGEENSGKRVQDEGIAQSALGELAYQYRYNFSLRNTSSLLNQRLKLDFNLRYIHTTEQDMLSQGSYSNPLVPVYLVPDELNKQIDSKLGYNYKDNFEVYDPELGGNVQFWPLGHMGLGMENPYWVINRNKLNRKRNVCWLKLKPNLI